MFSNQIVRRVFFSFHYQEDIWRVNQVRQSWRYGNEGFYDASIWESSQRRGEESLKALIREGIKNSSVTVVLIGNHTFERRWVRYEIARTIIRGNGLIGVHINQLKNQISLEAPKGLNPLDYLAIHNYDGRVFLAEFKGGTWQKYSDYTRSISLPPSWRKPVGSRIIRLSEFVATYDYNTFTKNNFSNWVQKAATEVGR